jgi:hypothetical protein
MGYRLPEIDLAAENVVLMPPIFPVFPVLMVFIAPPLLPLPLP